MNATRTLNKCRAGSRVREERGSTLIIVLIILSILVLMATTLSFTSKLEVVSSANFVEGIQARMAAVTGVDAASGFLSPAASYTAFTQSWAYRGDGPSLNTTQTGPLAEFAIRDESAKININAADEAVMASAFASILKTRGLGAGSALAIAREIVQYRYGPDGKPGGTPSVSAPSRYESVADRDYDRMKTMAELERGVFALDEFIPDPTLPPNGDDTPFLTGAELLRLPSMKSDVYEVLRHYVTVHSASRPVYCQGGRTLSRIDANTATAREIFDALSLCYPGNSENLLKQFAVNIADARDPDSIPTQIPGDHPDRPFIGIEKTPYINEIWPDSLTDDEDGDDGQYIELFNPYDEDLSIKGWKLVVAGVSVPLDGAISRRGFVVITDDYNNQNDPAPEDDQSGYGSFYDIFNVVRGGNARRIIEHREMEIPNREGNVKLYDNQGNLIDWFAWQGGTYSGVRRSFQRDDPRVRLSAWNFCTPLDRNAIWETTADPALDRASFQTRDLPFETPADIMDVFSGFSENPVAVRDTPDNWKGRTWCLPPIRDTGNPTVLGPGLLDIFTVFSRSRKSARDIISALGQVDEYDLDRLIRRQNQPEFEYGLININTAPVEILAALSGTDKKFAERVEQRRRKIEHATINDETGLPGAPFENLSDIFRLMGSVKGRESAGGIENRAELLDAFARLWPHVTVQSSTFTILSQNRVPELRQAPEMAIEDVRHLARSIVRAHVQVMPAGILKIINWAYVTD